VVAALVIAAVVYLLLRSWRLIAILALVGYVLSS
jgi:hypothetical protein